MKKERNLQEKGIKHKRYWILVFILVSGLALMGLTNSEEHEILFEKAKFTMETKGDLKTAIKLFEDLIKKFPNQREYAAKSQLYIGICSEKLGLEEAKKAYQKVVNQFPDQTETVRIAKEKLYLLEASVSSSNKTISELTLRKVDFPNGIASPDGKFICYTEWDRGDLAVFEIATGKKTRLTKAPQNFSEFALYSIWISGSDQIAYTWYNENENWDLRLINRDGTNLKILFNTDGINVHNIAGISNKGKIIFSLINKDNSRAFGSISVEGKEFKIINELGNTFVRNLIISPNGKFFAYDSPHVDNFRNNDIKVLSVDGKQESFLVEHLANDKLIG